MRLQYCLKCQRIVDTALALKNTRGYFCPTCQGRLTYFGRERVRLSPKQVLEAYDKKFTQSPIETFRGGVATFVPQPIQIDVLGCEDILKYDPENRDALYHLGVYYRSVKNMDMAKRYFEKVVLFHPAYFEGGKALAEI